MSILQGKRLNFNDKIEQNQQDADLLARVRHGDETAFEQLFHRLYPRLFRFIARTTRRTDLIDEIINDVMYVVWKKADTYTGQSLVSTWVLGIAYNKARQTLRSYRHGQDESLEDFDTLGYGDDGSTGAMLETADWLASAFDRLSAEHRAVIELTYYHGLHYSEIAELMGCPENTVKTRMHHARKKLAKFLNEN